ncbi:MAG: hypothetical protein ACPIOQ_85575, partial [Promethearchaeia archaeon]
SSTRTRPAAAQAVQTEAKTTASSSAEAGHARIRRAPILLRGYTDDPFCPWQGPCCGRWQGPCRGEQGMTRQLEREISVEPQKQFF